MSTDELTGVQALERKHPGLPLAPGKVERREFEYIRHGTRSFIISRDVVTGQIVEPYGGPRRTEADFLQHVEAVTASDRAAQRWHFVVDNLDTHRSESLVRWVARESGLELELGKKGKWGILANRESRAAFLSDPSHRIVFHYTPKHTSWMNQVEIWLSILVRKLLQRGSFKSVTDLKRERMYRAPTPRERERWHGLWLLAQGWSATQVAEALEREPHTIGNWLDNFRQGGAQGLVFEQTGGSPPS